MNSNTVYYRVEYLHNNGVWLGIYSHSHLGDNVINDNDSDLLSHASDYPSSSQVGYSRRHNVWPEHWFTSEGWRLMANVMEHLANTYPENVRIRREQLDNIAFSHREQVIIEHSIA